MSGGGLFKAEATGNDFLTGTGRWADRLASDTALVARLCHRRRGIGADGALALVPEGPATVRLVYRNADGSMAAFCANGTRVAALAAVELLGLPAELTVLTGRGPVPAVVRGTTVRLELEPPETPPRPIELEAAGRRWTGRLLTVGVPHLVLPVEELDRLDLGRVGPLLRWHPALGPAGANVHLVEPAGPGRLAIRSFERGVEAETLSCGSGAVAAALVQMASAGTDAVALLVRSGEILRVEALGTPPASAVHLEGPARLLARLEPLEALLDPPADTPG